MTNAFTEDQILALLLGSLQAAYPTRNVGPQSDLGQLARSIAETLGAVSSAISDADRDGDAGDDGRAADDGGHHGRAGLDERARDDGRAGHDERAGHDDGGDDGRAGGVAAAGLRFGHGHGGCDVQPR